MSKGSVVGGSLDSRREPKPEPLGSSASTWNVIIGALFGLITLVGLFAFAYLSSTNPQLCSTFQFQLLAGGFALGAALAGGFIGGGAGARGQSSYTGFSLIFGLTGGAALLVVTLVVFSIFAPKGCDVINSEQAKAELQQTKADLVNTKAALEKTTAALTLVTTERDAEIAANKAAKTELKRVLNGLKTVFPDAAKVSIEVGRIIELVTQSCSGGPHGTDPGSANAIRSISRMAVEKIGSAQTAINSIVTSVPPDLLK